ncbi:T9SS type A sorting domain-containing protein, partial [Flavobacterium sp.]
TPTQINCFGGTGSVALSTTGGTAPYTYAVNNPATAGLTAGTYTYSVTDAKGCSAQAQTTINAAPTEIIVVKKITNIACNGGTNGMVITSVSGGTAPYTILWSTGSTDFTISNLSAGTYTAVVTDSKGCSTNVSATVTQPNVLTSSKVITNVTCNGDSNGSVTATAIGGTAPYTILWSTGSTNFTVTGLAAGSYTALITDAHGCTTTVSATITQPQALALSFVTSNVTCYDGFGTAKVTVTGGTAPYTYSWNSTPVQTTQTASLQVGTYTVTVKDAKGCTVSGIVSIKLLACTGFTTITQGGYGATCNGNNWGCYLSNNFVAAFPMGLKVGSGSNFLRFSSAAAIHNFLPSGTTPRALNAGTLVNPTSSTYSNVLAGQAVALTLSLGFDNNANFSPSTTALGSLVISSGTFAGMTVSQVLAVANTILGGGASPYTAAQVNDALDRINRNYDNGTSNLGYLACPCEVKTASKAKQIANADSTSNEFRGSVVVYPNPVKENATIEFDLENDSNVSITIYNMNGQLINTVYSGNALAGEKYIVNLNASGMKTGVYILKLNTDTTVYTKSLIISN